MDMLTSLPSSRSSGSNGVSTPFEYVALTFAIMVGPLVDLSAILVPIISLYPCGLDPVRARRCCAGPSIRAAEASALLGANGLYGRLRCWGWVPACAGTTTPDAASCSTIRMGSRLRGNDGCWGRLRVGDGFPPSETFDSTVIPATNRHSREGGNPGLGVPCQECWASPPRCLPQRELRKGLLSRERRMLGAAAGLGMDSRLRRPLTNRHSREQPSFPRRRESRAGGSLPGMLGISAALSPATGVTQRSPFAGMWGCLRVRRMFARERRMFGGLRVGDGFPPARERRMLGAAAGLGMDSRFRRPLNNRHSRDQPSFPRRRESRAGGSLLGMLGISATLSPATGVTQRSPFAGTTDVWGACAGTTDVWGCCDGFPPARERRMFGGCLRVGDGFPPSETFEQPSFPRPTVIPAKAGIQGWGFPARNAGHLRRAVSRNGSYAKVSFRVNDGCVPARERGCLGVLRVGDGFPPARERRVFGGGCVLGMGSRLRVNDGCWACWR